MDNIIIPKMFIMFGYYKNNENFLRYRTFPISNNYDVLDGLTSGKIELEDHFNIKGVGFLKLKSVDWGGRDGESILIHCRYISAYKGWGGTD